MIVTHDDLETITCFMRIYDLKLDAKPEDIQKITFDTCTGEVRYFLKAKLNSLTQTIQLNQ